MAQLLPRALTYAQHAVEEDAAERVVRAVLLYERACELLSAALASGSSPQVQLITAKQSEYSQRAHVLRARLPLAPASPPALSVSSSSALPSVRHTGAGSCMEDTCAELFLHDALDEETQTLQLHVAVSLYHRCCDMLIARLREERSPLLRERLCEHLCVWTAHAEWLRRALPALSSTGADVDDALRESSSAGLSLRLAAAHDLVKRAMDADALSRYDDALASYSSAVELFSAALEDPALQLSTRVEVSERTQKCMARIEQLKHFRATGSFASVPLSLGPNETYTAPPPDGWLANALKNIGLR